MENIPESQLQDTPVKRPVLLTVLCILTFTWSGLNILSGLAIGTFFNEFSSVAADLAATYKLPGMEMITEGSPRFFFISAILYVVCIAGTWMMWNLRKNGFHIYTISQILLILAPMYFFKLPGPSLADIILAGVFIIFYSLHLRVMK